MSITHETRRESYDAVIPKSEARRQIILEVLGSREMTAHEIAAELHTRGITPTGERNYAAPRLTELKKAGKVEVIGKRFCQATDRNVAVWRRVKEEE